MVRGSRGALAYHQCVLGSIPGPGIISGLSFCWFSSLLWGFFSGFSGFPPSSKTNVSKFQFDQEFEGHGFISWRLLCVTLVKQSWFIYWLIDWLIDWFIRSVKGPDEPNPLLWGGNMTLSSLHGLTCNNYCFVPQELFFFNVSNPLLTLLACFVKMVYRPWLLLGP